MAMLLARSCVFAAQTDIYNTLLCCCIFAASTYLPSCVGRWQAEGGCVLGKMLQKFVQSSTGHEPSIV